MKDLAIYGFGGFGREVACWINAINLIRPQYNIIGFFDDDEKTLITPSPYGKVLGGFNELNCWGKPLAVVLAIGDAIWLEKIASKLNNNKLEFPNIIAPDVLFFDRESCSLGCGNLIGFRSLISCNVRIGNFNIFNTDIGIGHDTTIGSFNMFNPTVRISGGVTIGNANFFGLCSVVLQQIQIGKHTRIATNSVIMRNTEDNNTYFGNPAVKIRQ
jgi:sugar O-acyltransferase (sialic acid O-acetyltransferase NeuD family)